MPVAIQKDTCLLSYCLDVAIQGLPCFCCIFKTTVELSSTVTLGLESLILQLCSWIILWIWLVSLDAWITSDFKFYDENTKSYFWIYSLVFTFKVMLSYIKSLANSGQEEDKRKYNHILRMLKCLGQVMYLVEKQTDDLFWKTPRHKWKTSLLHREMRILVYNEIWSVYTMVFKLSQA